MYASLRIYRAVKIESRLQLLVIALTVARLLWIAKSFFCLNFIAKSMNWRRSIGHKIDQ